MRKSSSALLFYSTKQTKYSVNALVAALEKDDLSPIDVYVVDSPFKTPLLETISMLKRLYRRVLVGITVLSTQLPHVESLIGLLKRYHRDVVLIGGGPHPTGDPVGSLLKLGFNYIAYGEAEETIRELVEAVENNKPLEDACGIAYYDEHIDKVVVNRRVRRVNLDEYPPFPYWRNRFNPIEIMRGCPWACKYCQVSFMFKAKPIYRSIDSVLYYSNILLKQGMRDLRFIAPNSFAYLSKDGRKPDASLLEEFLSSLYELTRKYDGRIFFGTFPSEVRPDSVDYELARMVKRYVSNKSIIIGAQSGSDRLLKIINRGHSVDDIINATEALTKAGFRVDIDFIFGLPGETREDLEETIKVIEKLAAMGARIHAHTFMPLPGTPFAEAPPGRINPWLRRRLFKLLGKGLVYGDWLQQEREAEMIHRYRVMGVIFTGKKLVNRIRIRYC